MIHNINIKNYILIGIMWLSSYLFLISCSRNKVNDCIAVNIEDATKECLYYSDFFDSISYIQLSGLEERPLAEIKTLKFVDSLLIAFDEVSQRVLLFDNNGRFKFDIGSRGMASGEYINCRQIDIDRDKRNVLVYDIAKGSVLRYDLDGKYLKLDSLGRADDIAYAGNGSYLIANYAEEDDDQSGIFLVSPDPYCKRKLRACRDKVAMNKPFEFFDGESSVSIMTRSYEDDVLQWSGDSLLSLIKFDIEQNPNNGQIRELAANPSKRIDYIDRVYHFNYEDWIQIYFNYQGESRYLIYDKRNRNVEIVKGIVNDIDSIYGYQMPVSIHNSSVNIVDNEDSTAPRIQLLHFK